MTAIVGMKYFDGILMLADSEESFGNIGKSESDKLCRFGFLGEANNVGTVITGGAGDAHFIDCANQELAAFLNSSFDGAASIHANISKFAFQFWVDSIQPFNGFEQSYIPEFDMLIAVNYKQKTELFNWKKNKVLYVSSNAACVGAGELQIHPMLRDIQDLQSNVEAMLFYGIRILRHAKRLVQSVGGQTEAMALDDDGATTIYGRSTVKKIEDVELNLDNFVHKLIYLSISNITQKFADVDKNVESFVKGLPEIVLGYREQYKNILQEAFTKNPPTNH